MSAHQISPGQAASPNAENPLAEPLPFDPAALGRLAPGIGHDLNNLLMPAMALAGMVADALPPDSPERSDLDEIAQALDRARNLIRRMIDAALPLRPKAPVDLGRLARTLADRLRPSLPPSLTLIAEGADGIVTCGVAADLDSAVSLLVEAARDAGNYDTQNGRSGRITLRAGLDGTTPGWASLAIAGDLGLGEAERHQILDPSAGTARNVGLSLAALLARRQGARIECGDEHGGTRIAILLPLAPRDGGGGEPRRGQE